MNTVTKIVSATALAATALPFAAPLAAGEKSTASEPIVVRSAGAMQEWQDETTKDLNRALNRAPIRASMIPNETVVEVAFTMGADGKPENVEVLKGKGNWAARKAATYAVSRLDSLSGVPVANPGNVRFLASIVFANDRAKHRELTEQIRQERAARFASAGADRNVILLGG